MTTVQLELYEPTRDFNTVVSELKKNLTLTYEDPDGNRYWYKGTVGLLFELIGFLFVEDKDDFSFLLEEDKHD